MCLFPSDVDVTPPFFATGLARQWKDGAFRFEMIMPEEVYSAGAVRLQGQVGGVWVCV